MNIIHTYIHTCKYIALIRGNLTDDRQTYRVTRERRNNNYLHRFCFEIEYKLDAKKQTDNRIKLQRSINATLLFPKSSSEFDATSNYSACVIIERSFVETDTLKTPNAHGSSFCANFSKSNICRLVRR